MSYISLAFPVFVACLLIVYAFTPNRYKWTVLLAFSVIFYASSGLDKLAFVLVTSLVVYAASRRMQSIWQRFDEECAQKKLASAEKKALRQTYAAKSKRVLLLALILCVGVLVWCKIGLKTVSLLNRLTGRSLALSVLVPLGVSYYTFSSVGYLVDIYWRAVQAEKNYFKLLLCMIYFPHIVEGPIAKYEKLLPQFDKLTFPSYDRFCKGLQLALWGLFKKLVIADRLGIFVNNVFRNVEGNWGFTIFIACVFAAFQMYADFSGCMDIITGVSDIVGVKLEKNFNQPFLSRTVSEFWRRWHISLFNWLKDYIYMPILMSAPMGKVRKAVMKVLDTKTTKSVMTILPTACVFLIIGIWHDVGMRYVIHGLYWTVLFVASSFLEEKLAALSKRLRINTQSGEWHLFQTVRTFVIYALSFLTSTPKSVKDSVTALAHMISKPNPWVFWDQSLYFLGLDRRNFILAVLSIVLLMIVDVLQERGNVREAIARRGVVVRWAIYLAGIFAVLIFGIYGPGYDATAFIYELF